jgi:serine/threonine protein kinase
MKEYGIHSSLDHPCILKFIGVIKSYNSYSLVIEYAKHGDLASYLKRVSLPLSMKAKICHDIAIGLIHCHSLNIIHFDLKTENILLTEDMTPKISDFGVSTSMMELDFNDSTAGGTISWVAPERVTKSMKKDFVK